MIRSTLAVLAILAAGQASALSCLRPDVAQSFTDAANADESYIVVLGRFDVPPGALPAPDLTDAEPEPVNVQAMFRGRQLQADGTFAGALSVPVTLAQQCAGPWCGQMAQDQRLLAFLVQSDEGLVLEVGPCPKWAFANPTEEMLDTVAACVTGGDCTPAD